MKGALPDDDDGEDERPPRATTTARRIGRWTWEHLLVVWMLAAGAAVLSTLVRFPPGEPLRPLRPQPSTLGRAVTMGYGARWLTLFVRRERVLVAGWIGAPLCAAAITVGWAVARRRSRRSGRGEPR